MWSKRNSEKTESLIAADQADAIKSEKNEKETLHAVLKESEDQYNNHINVLRQKIELLELVNQLSKQFTSTLSPAEIFNQFYQEVNSLMDASVVQLLLLDTNGNNRSFYSNLDIKGDFNNDLALWSSKNKQEILLANVPDDYSRYVNNLPVLPDEKIPQSVIVLPLLIGNNCVGAISIFSFKKEAFSDFHIQLLKSVFPYFSSAVVNALVHEELMNSQAQIVSQEKNSSLGEIASGIAHEVLNPLQFLNEVSELSLQLLPQMEDTSESKVQTELKSQLTKNLEEILLHGKKAYEIVKDMMSIRNADSKKNILDVNRSVNGFFEIAWKAFQKKYESFEIKIEKNFQNRLPQIEIITEDFGIILINLFTNALYTLRNKKKASEENGFSNFIPELKVKTWSENDKIFISIKDNGMGIPEEIRQKVFLPFFTTKPKNHGTGLGLSISFDLITKTYGGLLTFNSETGRGSEFIIELPATTLL